MSTNANTCYNETNFHTLLKAGDSVAKEFKTERAVHQQNMICAGLMELMEATPYSAISVSQICQQAGIPRRTFYYYFDGKEEALSHLLHGLAMESALESMPFAGPTGAELEQNLTRFFLFWRDQHQNELKVLLRNRLEQELMLHCLQMASNEEHWAVLLANYKEEEKTISLLMGLSCVLYTLFHWCSNDFQQTPEYMAACITRVLTRPLYNEI